jgi:hypothetical protein
MSMLTLALSRSTDLPSVALRQEGIYFKYAETFGAKSGKQAFIATLQQILSAEN